MEDSSDPGGRSGDQRGKWLTLAVVLDLMVTGFELLGGIWSKSLVVWINFATGLVDGGLLVLNVWGFDQEARNLKRAKTIALASDFLLGVAACGLVCFATGRLFSGTNGHVNGWWILAVAAIAAAVNYGCSRIVPTDSINGQSARLKLRVGAVVGLATFFHGVLVHLLPPWIDPLTTIGVGIGIVIAVSRRLQRQRHWPLLEQAPQRHHPGPTTLAWFEF